MNKIVFVLVLTSFTISLENRPPVFNTITTMYAIKGQVNNHQIEVLDPENKTVNFKLIGESPEMTITNQGLISWTPKEVDKTYTVTIQSIDICGAMTSKQFTFETRKCPCEKENDGYCKWKTPSNPPEMECICPEGCTGQK